MLNTEHFYFSWAYCCLGKLMCPVYCQFRVATYGVPVERRPEYRETCKAHGEKTCGCYFDSEHHSNCPHWHGSYMENLCICVNTKQKPEYIHHICKNRAVVNIPYAVVCYCSGKWCLCYLHGYDISLARYRLSSFTAVLLDATTLCLHHIANSSCLGNLQKKMACSK